MRPPTRIAVLGSGRGSNFVALQRAVLAGRLNAEIALVISDLPDAPILERAREFHLHAASLPPSPFRTKLGPDAEIVLLENLEASGVRWVVLAGYMRVIKEPLLSRFPDRIVNIHPSLLPAFRGLRAWEQALKAGVQETGCTVHLVNEAVDAGRIIAQEKVPVQPGDTPESLHARIQEAEHRLYPAALAQLLASDH
jgi:phosphoribosylglycinamide formyltransferase-1